LPGWLEPPGVVVGGRGKPTGFVIATIFSYPPVHNGAKR